MHGALLEPDAESVEVLWEDEAPANPLKCVHEAGLFEGRVPHRRPLSPYRLRIRYRNGVEHTKHDAYYFSPQLSEFDLYLFGEGNHHGIYHKLGAHPSVLDGLAGTRFAVWAPNAERVSVVGSFNLWDGRRHAMQMRGSSGIWSCSFRTSVRHRLQVRDPCARWPHAAQVRPVWLLDAAAARNCSVVTSLDGHEWRDGAWMEDRRHANHPTRPISIYELHPGSWRRRHDRNPPFPNWRELPTS